MKDQLLKFVEQIRAEVSSKEDITNKLDEQYAQIFDEEKNSICDTLMSKIEKEEINKDNLQEMVISYGEEVKKLIERRQEVELRSDLTSLVQRAKINSRVDALSTMQANMSTLISELARENYRKR